MKFLNATLLALCLLCPLLPNTALAGFDEGLAAYNKKGYEQAILEWKPLAAQGNATSQYNLGFMYYNGQGVPQDFKEAVKWYRLAADQGHATAQNNLGSMFENGKGVQKDDKEAVKWYRMAADQGHATAQYALGVIYRNGREGVPQDYQEALKWYRLAVVQGDATALYNLGLMYEKGEGVAQNRLIAYALYNLAATAAVSSQNYATNYTAAVKRSAFEKSMNITEFGVAQNLINELGKPNNLLITLDKYQYENK